MAARPPPMKKSRRGANAPRVTSEERAKQFSEDLYTDGGVLFCKFCDHSVDCRHDKRSSKVQEAPEEIGFEGGCSGCGIRRQQ